MTPQEWIAQMGAGWNLGNTYECHNGTIANAKYRYWGAGGNWKCSVKNSDGTSIGTTSSVQVVKINRITEFSISFKYPQNGLISISLSHPKIVTGIQSMQFSIKGIKIDGIAKTSLTDNLTFPPFSGSTSTLEVDCATLFNDTVANDTAITITMEINGDALRLFPTADENVLSDIRKYYCTFGIDSWGSRHVKESHVKAVADAGFKSVRIPITWKDRLDPMDELGHVHVDTEFLEHIAEIINLFHSYGLSVVINMHHDDTDWLKTGVYLTDPTVSTRYKDIWRQIATYFKDYGDWLAFASNNETRNDKGVWEGAGVLPQDIYGLMQIQKDFYDVVRNIKGNEHRICMYPTYAAKQGAGNSSYTNPNDPEDKGVWHLPYDDPYGIMEVHPYNNGIDIIQKDNKKVHSKGIPAVYGEFGVNASQTHDKQTCINQAYMVAYAKFHGMGTYLWDDNGGMQMLRRDNCTMTNSKDFDKLWNGAEFNFIPSLVASAELKQKDILLNNRRTSCYTGDTVSVFLDSKENVIISNEGSSEIALNGNTFTAGTTDIDNLLLISYIGEYNTIDVTVEPPQKWITTTYDHTYEGWEHKGYSKWDTWKVTDNPNTYSIFLSVQPCCEVVKVDNTTNNSNWSIIEYDKSKQLIAWGDKAMVMNKDSAPYMLSPKCAYVAIQIANVTTGKAMQEGTYVTIRQRDMEAVEDKDVTSTYTDSLVNYNNYNVSIYRTIKVAGGMEYTLDMGMDCDIYIIEYNGDKVEAEKWYKNGDSFVTDLFTKTIRLEIVVPNNKVSQLIKNFNNKNLSPKLQYTDYATHTSQYNEKYSVIDEGGSSTPTTENKFCKFNNKILTYNGVLVRQ